jgi:hypothetical protein
MSNPAANFIFFLLSGSSCQKNISLHQRSEPIFSGGSKEMTQIKQRSKNRSKNSAAEVKPMFRKGEKIRRGKNPPEKAKVSKAG